MKEKLCISIIPSHKFSLLETVKPFPLLLHNCFTPSLNVYMVSLFEAVISPNRVDSNLMRCRVCWGFPGDSDGEESAVMQETKIQSLGWEDLLEQRIATHSSIFSWRIPWTEETCGL